MDLDLIYQGHAFRVALDRAKEKVVAKINDRVIDVRVPRALANEGVIETGSARRTAYFARGEGKIFVHLGGSVFEFEEAGAGGEDAVSASVGGIGGDSVSSSMPGLVVKVLVEVGQEVGRGMPLVIVEAMKMETPLLSPAAGRVKKINFSAGDLVGAGRPLVELDLDEKGE
ncbi:MAG: acetyl-CoA carboxylase biotin carboxyl carrier protein subunit [Candidatus Eisenbacteria bacterium]